MMDSERQKKWQEEGQKQKEGTILFFPLYPWILIFSRKLVHVLVEFVVVNEVSEKSGKSLTVGIEQKL